MGKCLTAAIAAIALACALVSPACAQSRRGELRGVWMGEGYNRDWPTIMKSLKDNGFNAIFPNFSIGDMSLYPSKTLALVPGGDPTRDELAEAAKAARANGIELHVWRIDWALWRTPDELLTQLDAAGRLQRNSRGQRAKDDPDVRIDWLCPSNSENRALEKLAMIEVIQKYDIAGIQFDYMRYPGADYCFCDGCKERFQQSQSVKVEKWPDDVRAGGPLAAKWQQWRLSLITSLVNDISSAAHALKPDISVSLAAWSDIDDGRDTYGQDWVPWARDGSLDFVCPMDYTLDDQELARSVERQVTEVKGAIPLYAGLGAFQMKSAGPLIDQIGTARSAGADGFVAFAYGSGDLATWLPELRASVTAQDPKPVPHGGPAARFSFSGDAVKAQASARTVVAGADLQVEMTLGWEPPTLTEQEQGAADAGQMLRRILDQRTPVVTYGERMGPTPPSNAERLSGRIVVENPIGEQLIVLGAFDTEYRFERKLNFAAPEGPFRLAIYGAVKSPDGKRDFVARAPLMVGM